MTSDLAPQFLRFGAVGTVGFIVDGGLLSILLHAGVDPYLARGFSFPLAVLTTWWLNRTWTFSASPSANPYRQLNRYLAVQCTGAAANYVVYALTVYQYGSEPLTALIGFAAGSIVGMFINYFGSRLFVFREH